MEIPLSMCHWFIDYIILIFRHRWIIISPEQICFLYPTAYTPVYKATILVTEKHRADFNFFGRFLPRLSRNDHSQVISIAIFCWGHST